MNEQDIKVLISQAVDGEILTDAQNAAIQAALRDSADLRAYESELLRLKQALDRWTGIESSLDWEQRMDKLMARLGIKEDIKMKEIKFSRSKWSVGVLAVLVVLVLFTTQIYVKRGLQGRLRSSADDIGNQYSAVNVPKYEAYYGPSNYDIDSSGTDLQAEYTARSSGKSGPQSPAPEKIDRKIIRTVDLNILVKNCVQAQEAILGSVRKFDGLVLNSQVNQYEKGSNGSIVFQVLPKNLDAAILEIKSFGQLESETGKADDVTGQYVDTEARLGNLRVVRERLVKLAAENTAKVIDILAVERELSRVTGEIEAMEARLKYLSQASAMATVTVNFHEKAKVQVAQGFSMVNSFRGALTVAIEVAANTFNAVIIVIGFLLPVAFWSLLIWGGYLIWKKLKNR